MCSPLQKASREYSSLKGKPGLQAYSVVGVGHVIDWQYHRQGMESFQELPVEETVLGR